MANTQINLKQLQQLFLSAKDKIEAKHKKPPKISAPVELKVETLKRLKKRLDILNAAKRKAIQEFDTQIKVQQKRITLLEKEVKEDKNKFNREDISKKPTPPKKRRVKKVPK